MNMNYLVVGNRLCKDTDEHDSQEGQGNLYGRVVVTVEVLDESNTVIRGSTGWRWVHDLQYKTYQTKDLSQQYSPERPLMVKKWKMDLLIYKFIYRPTQGRIIHCECTDTDIVCMA